MRQKFLLSLCLGATVVLSACEQMTDEEVERAVAGVNVIDENNLNDIMLRAGDPEEAVAYFRRTLSAHPERVDLKRGLAKSLVRAGKASEASRIWSEVLASGEASNDDRISAADTMIRAGDWTKAREVLNTVPPTVESFDRYRLEAMVADAKKDWKRADSFYETAVGLTTRPAGVYNNWGFSKLTRGDYKGAEAMFLEAITYDDNLFTAKNNLMMARGAQRKYDMPVFPMTQKERAQLLHTLGLAAIKQGDVTMGKTLLREAISTHPQHFDEAVRALRALEANVAS
ncbi:MAG: hypothetical protein CR993_00385 [Rhodobacterales bacterium]|nr:MAG: hypothetical protein CR993_00385 [Rhodobacterales bacterium]